MTLTREAEPEGELLIRYLLEDEEIMAYLTTQVRTIMRKYECRSCHAQVGEHCRTSSGSKTTVEHNDRYYQACDAGELPIDITEFYS